MNAIMLFGVLVMSYLTVTAQEIPLRDGLQPQNSVTVTQIAAQVRPGSIIVMGENHGFKTAQQGQMELLQALRAQGLSVSTGLEFFYYPDQSLVEDYRQGRLSEVDFLQKIQWGNPPFDFYRSQALFPRYELGERTLAINAPRSLTGRISKVGVAGLTPEESLLLPPAFQVGRASYKERFLAMMPHLPSPEAGDRYFEAQSTWDDTMAWKVAEFMSTHPDQVLVITVGDFHAAYGGGLPDRILARTGVRPVILSYVNTQGLTQEEIEHEINPSPVYGPRADYIWFAQE